MAKGLNLPLEKKFGIGGFYCQQLVVSFSNSVWNFRSLKGCEPPPSKRCWSICNHN